jgi:hypothetical protein
MVLDESRAMLDIVAVWRRQILRLAVKLSMRLGASTLLCVALLASSQPALAVFVQQGSKLVGTGAVDAAYRGQSVAVSADGSTAIVGAPADSSSVGAAWVFRDGATTLGSRTLSAGTATITTSALTTGKHSIKALYGDASNFATSTTSVVTQRATKWPTTTSVVAAPTPSLVGQSVTFTATVSSGAGTPTGTVIFKDGATTLGTIPLSAGTATLSVSTLTAGGHTIVAVYGGNSSFAPSTSSFVKQTVNKRPTTTSIVAAPNPTFVGQSVTFTATVSSGAATPTGTVTFKDGETTLGTGTLSAGTATITTSTLTAGNHNIKAVYGSDASFATSISSVVTQTVNKWPTTTSVVAAPNPSFVGQSVTFTATIAVTSPGSGTPTGTMTFTDGASTLGTVALSAGTATITTSTLIAGNHSIKAVYGGDASFAISTSPVVTQTVNKGATTTSIDAAPNPSVLGQSVTFTSTVSSSRGTPTGTVTFKDGDSALGTFALSAGVATLTTSTLTAGKHRITAVYGGDASFATSTSSSVVQTVNKFATSADLSSSRNPSIFGQSVTFTATVTATSPASGTPTGTVTFKAGATTLGSDTLSAGTATLTTSTLTGSNHTITAVYSGDASFATSTAPSVTQTVNKGATTASVGTAPSPSAFGQSVTFTATIAVTSPASGAPTGTVTFKDGVTTLGTGTLSAGTATFSTSALTVGNHAIKAVYNGDANFAASISSFVTQRVTKGTTTTSVVGAPNPSTFGQPVTFTATVAVTSPAAGTPTGTVTFVFDGGSILQSASLSSAGTATFTISTLTVGNHNIKAFYGGDAGLVSSTSSGVKQRVNISPTTTSLTAAPNPSKPGQPIPLTATVIARGGAAGTPTGAVTFTKGTKTLGTAMLSGGKATLTIAAPTTGKHAVTASYPGTATLASSTSAPFNLMVDPRVGPEFRVNTHTASAQQLPAIAPLTNSGSVVVWASNAQDSSGYGIYAQLYTAAGKPTGLGFPVNTHTAGDQTMPAVAGLQDGGFIVAWASKGQDGSGYGVYAQRYNAAGKRAGTEFRVNTTTASDQWQPSIAVFPAGGFVIAWVSIGQTGADAGVYAQLYDSAGKARGTEVAVSTTMVDAQSKPAVASRNDGSFVVAWAGHDVSGNGVYAQRYSAAGKPAGQEFLVNTHTLGDQSMPSIAGIKDDSFVVTWASLGQDGSGYGIYAQRYTAAGNRTGSEFRVNIAAANDQWQPSVAAFPGGGFVVVWASAGQDGSGQGVYAQAYGATGAALDVELRVNITTAKDQWQPSVSAFGGGGFVVTWTSKDQDGSLEGVYGQRFLMDGVEGAAPQQPDVASIR